MDCMPRSITSSTGLTHKDSDGIAVIAQLEGLTQKYVANPELIHVHRVKRSTRVFVTTIIFSFSHFN
jgi:hypothetical protein